jgi:putative membrane-bound dehydrogenase-like protein
MRFGMLRGFLCLSLLLTASFASAQREFGFDNRKSSGQPYLKPEETVAQMQIADGFEVKLFAAEPQLVNPIAMTVDEKGRVWVVECFEYPKRTQKGQMPRDRIKILEDTDGDGVCDKVTIFAEGKQFPKPFDLASGIEVGNGGVYLGAPPYLWFIKDTNGDDKADQFDILLEGFGSQDTHETLNTFNWGPDGKLYGLHGVFTYSEVKPTQADGPATRMNGAMWSYDPRTKKFSTFAEGTSNPWGCDYRNTDGQYILCCCVIPHLFHLTPGGVYKRQAGQSFNPYVYSYLNEICDHTFHKESGWAHAGLISLDTPIMPEAWRSSVIFGSIHGTSIKRNILKPNGSTYTASRGDDFLQSKDKNFRPINLRWGPNGEIYCIDWHDQNPCHQAAAESWDYDRGRVYRFQTKGLKTKKAADLSKKETTELRKLAVGDPNPYVKRTALRLLAERAEGPAKIKLLDEKEEAPIKFDSIDEVFVENAGRRLSQHSSSVTSRIIKGAKDSKPEVRGWIYRLLLDKEIKESDAEQRDLLTALAVASFAEPSVIVRRDLASGILPHAKSKEGQCLVQVLMQRSEDVNDPVMPQLLWLGFELGLATNPMEQLALLRDDYPGNKLVVQRILPLAVRRLAASEKQRLEDLIEFVLESKDKSVRLAALDGLVLALQGRQVDAPANWKRLGEALAKEADSLFAPLVAKLGVSFRDREAMAKAIQVARDEKTPRPNRVEAIRALGLARPTEALGVLQQLATDPQAEPEVRVESLRALSGFEAPQLAKELLSGWKELNPQLKNEVVNLLAARKEWAKELLGEVGANRVARTELTDNIVLRIQGYNDKDLNAQIEKVWGRLRKTPAELEAVIQKMRGELSKGNASFERGRGVFENQCAKCHKFDGKGSEVGPNIEGAGRDVEYLLTNVLDPNRVIGSPYFMRTVFLDSGVSHAGVLVGEDDQTLTLKMENSVVKTFTKKEIEKVQVQEKSLMPEGLSNNMTVQDFRDLVRYLMANPFVTEVRVGDATPLVGPDGRIALPDSGSVTVSAQVKVREATAMPLTLGIKRDATLRVNDQKVELKGSGKDAAPDQIRTEIKLLPGVNTITVHYEPKGKGEAVYLRLIDPDRKVSYAEPRPKK